MAPPPSSVSSTILPTKGASRWRRIRHRLKVPSGWRFSLLSGAVLAVVVLVVNLGALLWAVTQPTPVGDQNGRRILFDGTCAKAKNISTALHVLINVLSSLLLGASNYGMQCLSVPTRSEVDKAHAKGTSLEIRVPSTRNIKSISSERVLLWLLLVLSSLPLHFLYNSVIFSSFLARNYRVLGAPESFTRADYVFAVDGTYNSVTTHQYEDWGGFYEYDGEQVLIDDEIQSLQRLAATGQLENLTNSECIDACRTPFMTSRSGVVLVVGQLHDNASLTAIYADQLRGIRSDAAAWEFPFASNHSVTYCLSKPEEEHCRVNFSILFAAIVVAANAAKATVLIMTLLYTPDEPLLVLGDAISSFLARPDPYSIGMYLGGIVTISVYLIVAIQNMLGATDLGSLYNSMFTRMLAAREWSGFGVTRKPLRMSAAPTSAQRERYFLQLPYRFGVPLLGFSVLVHWLISQSLFVVAVESLDPPYSADIGWYLITCGYSPIAIIFALAVCCLLVAAATVTGCWRLPSAIPIVGSCSLAIAAAYHGIDEQPQPDAALDPLQWGVIAPPSSTGPGHCGFSAEEVGEPEEGCHYGTAAPSTEVAVRFNQR
ncbi:hypothetical protein B0T26DRAFT_756492 [Lasiosphaeria miniovina]|uniref:DUF6536 domain-containing protein n=1 Tax=Lasiosphaeria miniovina TaxID=1954250 RepID=A0AA40DP89_9PEZI|nr:uncharacterized protein B0T26DRAFT_756492 [Lasiosphaeria miniovina]KAK0707103.1 hypothetical protein B0T26DRAFT_756492 [Lasiosphaeria miniovina]